MSRPSKLSDEERIRAVQEYLDGKGSYSATSKKYGINIERFRFLEMGCFRDKSVL